MKWLFSRSLFFLLLLVASLQTFAATGFFESGHQSPNCFATRTAACTELGSHSTYWLAGSVDQAHIDTNGTTCVRKNASGGYTGQFNFTSCSMTCSGSNGRDAVTGACGTCPTGQSVQTDGTCGCPSGTTYSGSACITPCGTAKTIVSFNVAPGGSLSALTGGSANQCVSKSGIGNCSVTLTDIPDLTGGTISGGENNCKQIFDGSKTCYFYGVYTGATCSTTGNASTGDTSTQTGKVTFVTTNSDGSSSTTTKTSTLNTDGTLSTQTDVATTAAGGTTTTTSSTTSSTVSGTASGGVSGGTLVSGGSSGVIGDTIAGSGADMSAGACDPRSTNYEACVSGSQTTFAHTSGTATSFSGALSNFQSGIAGTPIGRLASSSGIGGAVNVGSCPTASFAAFNRTFTIDAHCALFDSASPTITAVMHVVYIVGGILIILSA